MRRRKQQLWFYQYRWSRLPGLVPSTAEQHFWFVGLKSRKGWA